MGIDIYTVFLYPAGETVGVSWSERSEHCGFSQRAKRSAWKMRQQGVKRVGAPKVRCLFSRRAIGDPHGKTDSNERSELE